jgi:uncharacterized membrane protein
MSELSSSIVAVYPDHESAEEAVKILSEAGFSLKHISIMGRDFQATETPVGFVTTGDIASQGAATGAWAGGIFGLLMGAAFLILPGVGPVVIAGPLSAALLGGIEGAIAGAAIGGLSGALVGLGVSKEHAIKYETELKAGKFVVTLRGTPDEVARAQGLLQGGRAETAEVYHPMAV